MVEVQRSSVSALRDFRKVEESVRELAAKRKQVFPVHLSRIKLHGKVSDWKKAHVNQL